MASREEVWGYVCDWVGDEYHYATTKVTQDPEADDQKTSTTPEYWEDQISMYVHRSIVLGFDTPAGRQAAAKAATTAMCFLESVVRVHGPLPEPGVSSGQNLDTIREL